VGIVRVLRTAKTTLSRTFFLDEAPTDATGPVTVAITREGGTPVQSGTASGPTAEHVYSFTFQGSDVLDRLAVTWQATVGGDVIVIDQDVIEVVGGFYFGLAEARAIDVVFANANRYPTSDVIEVRMQTEDEAETITGQSWVPRFERETLTGFGDRPLRLTHPWLRGVRAMEIGGEPVDPVDLAGIGADPLGLIRDVEWPYGQGAVVVEYEHGRDRPTPDMVRAAKTRWRSLMFERHTRTPLPDRSEAFTRSEVGLVKYGQETADMTGIPSVDAVYQRHPSPRPEFG
jgi:hypothetical protein